MTPFIEAAQRFAEHKRRVWSAGLKKAIEAIEADEALDPAERVTKATDAVLAAKKMPPLPPITQDEMLSALERAAIAFGLEPTIMMRADLRKVIDNKPPPDLAHARCLEVLAKHKQMQELKLLGNETRH